MKIDLRPIGFVRGGRTEPTNDDWDRVTARIELDTDWLSCEAILGLDSFSHAEVIYYFHKNDPETIVTTTRHPRNNMNWPLTGIFAQRVHSRPNMLGITTCHILGVDGTSVHVRGLDAIDGSPVIDIKPYLSGFAPRGEVREPDWAGELMSDYWRIQD
ncbi:MAG: SAM-dependent methyltransferase [Rhodospirillales bacterium]|nr:SAM-dependent methyltransferase [Rhodospirillales bacterium]